MVVIDWVREGRLTVRPAAERVTRWAGYVALWLGLFLMSLHSLTTTEWREWWPWRLLIVVLSVGPPLVILEMRHRRVGSPVRASEASAQRTPEATSGQQPETASIAAVTADDRLDEPTSTADQDTD